MTESRSEKRKVRKEDAHPSRGRVSDPSYSSKRIRGSAGRFHHIEKSKDYNIISTIGLWIMVGVIYIILPNTSPLKVHAMLWYLIFIFFNILAIFKGLYKKKIAHSFFESIKAVDIWLHILGMFSIYIIAYVFFTEYTSLTIIDIIFVAFYLGIIWELIEYISQTYLVLKDQNLKPDIHKYSFWLREEFPNIAQDIICNTIGILLSYLYVLWILTLL